MTDYQRFVLEGRAVSGLDIIDAHDHIGPWNNFRVSGGGSTEALVARADQLGVHRLCLTAHAAIGPDMHLGNDIVQDALRRFPDRAMGYVTIKPCPEEEMLAELKARFQIPGFFGVKLHPDLHGRQAADPVYAPAYAFAASMRVPVLIHTWSNQNVYDTEKMARAYPCAFFIIAHLGGTPDALENALAVIARNDNVFGDTALSAAPKENIAYAVKKIGAEKLLFGTDMPFYDPSFTLSRVLCAGLDDKALQNVLGGNVIRLCRARREGGSFS